MSIHDGTNLRKQFFWSGCASMECVSTPSIDILIQDFIDNDIICLCNTVPLSHIMPTYLYTQDPSYATFRNNH